MSQSTRRSGAPGAGGGGAGEGPAPPSPGASASRRQRLLDGLLRGRDDGDLARLALRLRHDLRVPNGVLLACAGAEDDGEKPLAALGRALAGRIPHAAAVTVADAAPPHACVVVPVAAPLAWGHALRVAAEVGAQRACLVLARPPVTGLRALRAAYFRALADAGLARAARLAGPVLLPDDLAVPRMLALLDAADQRALLAPIRSILALPAGQRSAYISTLDALRRGGGTQAGAAGRLHLHVNSVRYRIDRIEEMTGRRLDDPADRLALDLAVLLVLLRGFPLPAGGGDDFGLALMEQPERPYAA